ncbi:MAG: hypothetical protein LBJ41_03575 [Treponema sp.]|jgi:hypothetical protein|nr:hypothetical protein [Treponema sp.]
MEKQKMNKRSVLWMLLGCLATGMAYAQDLSIDFRYNCAQQDSGNYLSYTSGIRYIEANKDSFDAVSGASRQHSTSLFAPLETDIMGRATISKGFRGLLLFSVSADVTRQEDNLHVYQEGKVITMEFVHRGIAYQIQTDSQSRLNFPRGRFLKRTIGYIEGHDPQFISQDFSSDGTVSRVDWKKVWDPATPSGRAVSAGNATQTSSIQTDYGDMMAMFNWDGTLDVQLDNQSVLTITGVLRPVKR